MGPLSGGFIQNPLNDATSNYLLGTGLLASYSNAGNLSPGDDRGL